MLIFFSFTTTRLCTENLWSEEILLMQNFRKTLWIASVKELHAIGLFCENIGLLFCCIQTLQSTLRQLSYSIFGKKKKIVSVLNHPLHSPNLSPPDYSCFQRCRRISKENILSTLKRFKKL